MFKMLGQASLAMQTAFSCLLVCLLEFYYRRVGREPWMRWFACTWIAQAVYVASLSAVFGQETAGIPLRLAIALLGYAVPPTIALTGVALWRGENPSRVWIATLYSPGLAGALTTLIAALPYSVNTAPAIHIHSIPRYLLVGAASLLTAAAFARHARQKKLLGSLVTAGAWAGFGVINIVRAWQWYSSPNWALSGAETHPDLLWYSLVTFVTNSAVWIVMSIGVGLLLTETAERSERRAIAALRDLEEAQTERSRLARIVERSRNAIMVASAGQLRYLNGAAARLLGFTSAQIPSLFMRPLGEVCGVAQEDPLLTQMEAAVRSDGVWEAQSEWRNGVTGERIPVLVSAFAMGDHEAEMGSIGLIGRDLRERLRLEEELRQAQRQEALGRLAGGIAHDFNNLLTVIMGYASLALDKGLSETLRNDIGEVLQASRRAAAITERLRAFGRRQTLRATVFDLNALIVSMRGTLEKLAEGEVELAYELAPEPVMVRADSGQIEQVLMNLVLNARHAIVQSGRIVVRTGRAAAKDAAPGDHRELVKIEVEDSGAGIEPNVLEHIFDPYFTTRSTGTGLGLSMAYGIVRQSEGQIRVASQPGSGSTFTVLLPAGSAGANPGPKRVEASAEPLLNGGETLMVVDDRPEVAKFVAASLEHYGYRVAVYTDSDSALAAVREGAVAPQLVVRDVMMPGIPLSAFAERLREMRPGIPMVLMSGLPEVSLSPVTEATGGYFIAKPFTPDQLAALVRRVLDAASILAASPSSPAPAR